MTYVITRGDSSRNEDLGNIERARDSGSTEAAKILNDVYRKSHDENITRARRELIDAHKNRDVPRANEIEDRIRYYERSNYGR